MILKDESAESLTKKWFDAVKLLLNCLSLQQQNKVVIQVKRKKLGVRDRVMMWSADEFGAPVFLARE